jgi:hypothetical protein
VVAREPLSGAFPDEPLLHQPPDGPEAGPGITHCVPDGDQLGMVFVQLGPEAPERSLPLQRLAQALAGDSVADALPTTWRACRS